jgi:hypothetical protein
MASEFEIYPPPLARRRASVLPHKGGAVVMAGFRVEEIGRKQKP